MKNTKIVLLKGAKIPTKASEGAAAYDVYLPEGVYIRPGRQVIPLNFKLSMEPGYEAKIEPRSGFSSKGMEDAWGARHDADVIQGKIDWDYRGPVGVIIISREQNPFYLAEGTRIAQMTFYKVEDTEFEVVDELDETERGEGGFGHSGAM